jgi:hypothetical protein
MALVSQSEICTLLKCETKTLLRFLDERGVKPAQEYNFGRGKMRAFDRDQVMPLLPSFDKWRGERMAVAAEALKANQRKPGDTHPLHAKIDAISAKLDRILSLWEEK